MGSKTEYICEKCGFTINDYDLQYFVDEETNYVVEHTSGMLTFDMGHGSKIKGRVMLSFCLDCSSGVHFYYNENESYVEEIRLALEQDEEDFKDILDEKYEYRVITSKLKGAIGPENKTYGECPECGKEIPLIIGDECECPKCGGELRGFMTVLYD